MENQFKSSLETKKILESRWKDHWIQNMRYSITKDGHLVRFDGFLSDGWAVFECLYGGWWEAPEACAISYKEIAEARPVSMEKAEEIIREEERPIEERPSERNFWISC